MTSHKAFVDITFVHVSRKFGKPCMRINWNTTETNASIKQYDKKKH